MRPIHIAHLDKARPVLLLTREAVRPVLNTVSVAPITRNIRGLSTEILLGPANGLDQPSAAACDHITTVPTDAIGDEIGFLLDTQEADLTAAIRSAFGLG